MENKLNKSWLERNLTNRWLQLIVASAAMIMISNLQYSWTLFTTPLVDKLDSNLVAIQYAFTLFVMFQTFVQPAGGYLFDRFGSKLVFTISGLLVSIGWAMMGRVTTLSALYFFYSMSGVGAAVIYSGCVGISIKWFPDKRGLATGIIAGAFGLGSMPFVPLIDGIINSSGVTNAFAVIGLMQGIIIIAAAFVLYLLGITTLVWAFVVGGTGVINTWADLMIKYWQYDQLNTLLAQYKDQPVVAEAQRGSLQASLEAAQAHAPGMKLSFIAFPGTSFSSPHHNTFFLRGKEPLTSRLLQPVLVDAQSAAVTASPKLPWYLTALLVSQPLHFGDYGGMPMKVIWALLDIATIIVLGSGLYLWLKRRQPRTLTEEAGVVIA